MQKHFSNTNLVQDTFKMKLEQIPQNFGFAQQNSLKPGAIKSDEN